MEQHGAGSSRGQAAQSLRSMTFRGHGHSDLADREYAMRHVVRTTTEGAYDVARGSSLRLKERSQSAGRTPSKAPWTTRQSGVRLNRSALGRLERTYEVANRLAACWPRPFPPSLQAQRDSPTR